VRRLWLLIRVGLAGLAFLGFWLGGLGLVLLAFPCARWRHRRAAPVERAAACQRWVQRAFTALHDYMRVMGLLNFQPRAVDARTPGRRFVLVANHPTLVDVAALSAAYGRLTCAAKPALFRTPVVGQILRACGYLDGGNGGAFAGAALVGQAVDSLTNEMPVLVFPEGTRSPMGGLQPFKRGAFEISCRADAPVLAVVIRCDPPALNKGRPWYDIPSSTAHFTVTPLIEMNPRDFDRDAARMAAHCEALYRRALGVPTAESTPAPVAPALSARQNVAT
jgi:1-acyl-sn-glycerol-3-phosphate acyltransferase